MANWIISSSVLILGVIALRFLLKGKISLRLQYGLWALVLIRLLYPFSIGETVVSIGNWLEKTADSKEVQQIVEFTQTPLPSMSYDAAYEEVADKYAQQGIDIQTIPEAEFSETIDYEIMETMTSDGKSIAEMAEFVWLIGSCVFAFFFIFSNLRFSGKLEENRSLLVEASHMLFPKENVVKKGGNLPVYISDRVETPCLYGLFHPAIYVTAEVMSGDDTLRHVVEHERTHYIHKDHIWSVLRALCLMIHWYNPLVWYAAVLSKNDAELACDEATILRLGEKERASYGRTLIGLTCEKRPTMFVTATTMTGSGKSIKERISLIAKKPKMAVATLVAVILLAVVAVIFTFTGAKEQYDSFEEWTNSLEAEQVLFAEVQNGYTSSDPYYELTSLETRELLELIQSIPEESCFRRKQTVGQLEDYHLDFTVEKTEEEWQTIIFHCLEDGTLLVIYDNEMGNFAGEGMDNIDLMIECDELWNYIVDTVKEKGKINVKENSSASEETTDTEEEDILIGSTEEGERYETTPTIEINNILKRTNAVNITLYQADVGVLNTYEVKKNEYGGDRLSYICEAFEWTRVDNPDLSSCEFWISVESTDGAEKMTFYDVGEGLVECSWSTGHKIYWQGTKNEEIIGVSSLWGDVRHVFDNREVEMLNLTFEETGDAAQAAHTFAYEIFGNHYMNLSPGNSYGFDEYEVVKLEIDEINEDGTQVEAWLTYAFFPWDINSASIWAGNTDYATGEYEGKLWANCRFTLEKAEDGVWRCIGVGTGGATE